MRKELFVKRTVSRGWEDVSSGKREHTEYTGPRGLSKQNRADQGDFIQGHCNGGGGPGLSLSFTPLQQRAGVLNDRGGENVPHVGAERQHQSTSKPVSLGQAVVLQRACPS